MVLMVPNFINGTKSRKSQLIAFIRTSQSYIQDHFKHLQWNSLQK